MLAAVQEGGTAFEQVHGDRFFEYLSRNPEQEAVFQGSMTGRAEDEAGHVVAAYDFGDLPAGADAYLLSRVLHDWADDDARRILAACRWAMPAGGRLLIVEALLPERAADQPAVIRLDLYMLVLLGEAAPAASR